MESKGNKIYLCGSGEGSFRHEWNRGLDAQNPEDTEFQITSKIASYCFEVLKYQESGGYGLTDGFGAAFELYRLAHKVERLDRYIFIQMGYRKSPGDGFDIWMEGSYYYFRYNEDGSLGVYCGGGRDVFESYLVRCVTQRGPLPEFPEFAEAIRTSFISWRNLDDNSLSYTFNRQKVGMEKIFLAENGPKISLEIDHSFFFDQLKFFLKDTSYFRQYG